MDRQEIEKKMNIIFCNVFDDESIKIFNGMTAEDIEEWDSLNHITLIISIEKEFDLKLNLADVEKLEDVGGMIELLFEKMNS